MKTRKIISRLLMGCFLFVPIGWTYAQIELFMLQEFILPDYTLIGSKLRNCIVECGEGSLDPISLDETSHLGETQNQDLKIWNPADSTFSMGAARTKFILGAEYEINTADGVAMEITLATEEPGNLLLTPTPTLPSPCDFDIAVGHMPAPRVNRQNRITSGIEDKSTIWTDRAHDVSMGEVYPISQGTWSHGILVIEGMIAMKKTRIKDL